MSILALNWAFKLRVGSSSAKFVLVRLADMCREPDFEAWPSVAQLVQWTELDRKSVFSALKRLMVSGFISDTGKRIGRTGRITVYRVEVVNDTKNGTIKSSRFSQTIVPETERLNSPKNGTQNLYSTVPKGTGGGQTTPPRPYYRVLKQLEEDADNECKKLILKYAVTNSLHGTTWNPPTMKDLYDSWHERRQEIRGRIARGEYIE